jgi:alkanesulfonate monooxygenase
MDLAASGVTGVRTFVLDIPQEPDDLYHAGTAIERAVSAMDGGAS